MPKIDTPCHNCTDRHEGCHGDCEKYKAYKERMNKLHQDYSASTSTRSLFNSYIADRTKKSKFKK